MMKLKHNRYESTFSIAPLLLPNDKLNRFLGQLSNIEVQYIYTNKLELIGYLLWLLNDMRKIKFH